MFLKPTQEANVKKDTISQILKAAGVEYAEGADVLEVYKDNIDKAILVNINGDILPETLVTSSVDSLQVYGNSDLKAQMVNVAEGKEAKLPVYIFKNGITVVPCYGAGLWGPIWGYVGVKSDLVISKACFGHKGETPGLGAKITDEPTIFADLFTGKKFNTEVKVGKGVNPERKPEINAVDAISGATITSNATGVMINQWREFYQNYFNTVKVNDTTVVVATDSVAVCDTVPVVIEPVNKVEE
jgi:Na+-transporting NADH:ubiquinone oxidoreductase subunit C